MIKSAYLELLKSQIKSGHFPKTHPHFAGANFIITNNPGRNHEEGDTVIITEFADSVSWFIDQLKVIYVDELNYLNKHEFYQEIGKVLTKSLNDHNKDLFDCLENVIAEIESNWN